MKENQKQVKTSQGDQDNRKKDDEKSRESSIKMGYDKTSAQNERIDKDHKHEYETPEAEQNGEESQSSAKKKNSKSKGTS